MPPVSFFLHFFCQNLASLVDPTGWRPHFLQLDKAGWHPFLWINTNCFQMAQIAFTDWICTPSNGRRFTTTLGREFPIEVWALVSNPPTAAPFRTSPHYFGLSITSLELGRRGIKGAWALPLSLLHLSFLWDSIFLRYSSYPLFLKRRDPGGSLIHYLLFFLWKSIPDLKCLAAN